MPETTTLLDYVKKELKKEIDLVESHNENGNEEHIKQWLDLLCEFRGEEYAMYIYNVVKNEVIQENILKQLSKEEAFDIYSILEFNTDDSTAHSIIKEKYGLTTASIIKLEKARFRPYWRLEWQYIHNDIDYKNL